MRQTPGFLEYVAAAFTARPFGMFVPPNWIGMAAFAFLGLANPGFWVLGAGVELGYLALLATNARFQRTVAAGRIAGADGEWHQKIDALLARLEEPSRHRHRALAARCQSILDQQWHGGDMPHGIEAQSEGLGRLLWVFLRLLVAQQAIQRVLAEAGRGEGVADRIHKIDIRMAEADLSDDLRRSLSGQLDILKARQAQQSEAHDKLAFLDAELARVQQQVELIREQAALSTDPELLSQRIDQIAATLGGTSQWIRDQQKVFGAMEDLLADPPPLATAIRVRESQ